MSIGLRGRAYCDPEGNESSALTSPSTHRLTMAFMRSHWCRVSISNDETRTQPGGPRGCVRRALSGW